MRHGPPGNGLSRRDFLTAALGAAAATVACRRTPREPNFDGRLLGQGHEVGHKLRDGFRPRAEATKRIGTAIVGGGISGLSAAWRLARAGIEDYLVLELEPHAGGTSAFEPGGAGFAHPWGAHYVPVPNVENRALVSLLKELGVVERIDDDGAVICAEEVLCRAPQERLFYAGMWHEGLYLREGASADDLRQIEEFHRAMEQWAAKRDGRGRRGFTLPVADCSDDREFTALDRISMADFLNQHGWTSPRLRWWVDYACRDDFGLTLEQTSAWAGVFYYAARLARPNHSEAEYLTWPEGNGRLVRHLAASAGHRLRTRAMVTDLVPVENGVEVHLWDTAQQRPEAYLAEHVVFALPKFLARHLIAPFRVDSPPHLDAFTYGSWVVANIELSGRPDSRGFPDAWDNVIYESRSLGYVSATHQLGLDHGPTAWTWYLPLCGDATKLRNELLASDWKRWSDAVLADLTRAHLDLEKHLTRIDVWKWGHAMISPVPGFVWGGARQKALEPLAGRIHFANTDLSGVALFEEAHYHGVRAAEEVLRARDLAFESML